MYLSHIQETLRSFVPIQLDEMASIKLMNRVETKSLFNVRKLPGLLDRLAKMYKILEIEHIRAFPYSTTYLDTSDFLFLNQQLTGKLARHKVRYRKYESSGLSFLEVKIKTNKNRTIKWRIENSLIDDFPDEIASKFIREYFTDKSTDLKPVLIDNFYRITLAGIELKERITLDFNLKFSSFEGIKTELPFLAIAELKTEGYCRASPFNDVLKKNGIRPTGFSKYCIGNALLRDIPRKNILKPKMLLINKIENEFNRPYIA